VGKPVARLESWLSFRKRGSGLDNKVRARVTVRGRVQGVFFRGEARREALSLGLDGWVRNSPDGIVEAVFEGDRIHVERAIKWCRRGPPGARVDDLDATWEDPRGEEGFKILY